MPATTSEGAPRFALAYLTRARYVRPPAASASHAHSSDEATSDGSVDERDRDDDPEHHRGKDDQPLDDEHSRGPEVAVRPTPPAP